jgi:hypothetical protein
VLCHPRQQDSQLRFGMRFIERHTTVLFKMQRKRLGIFFSENPIHASFVSDHEVV